MIAILTSRQIRLVFGSILIGLLFSCSSEGNDSATDQTQPNDNVFTPWQDEAFGKSAQSSENHQKMESHGHLDVCEGYKFHKKQLSVVSGTYHHNILNSLKSLRGVFAYEEIMNYCDQGNIDISHNLIHVDGSKEFEFFQNELNQTEHVIYTVNNETYKSIQLFGGPFEKGSYPYYSLRDFAFYKVSPTKYLMTARPSKWTIREEGYVMYHLYDLERKTVTQFADKSVLVENV